MEHNGADVLGPIVDYSPSISTSPATTTTRCSPASTAPRNCSSSTDTVIEAWDVEAPRIAAGRQYRLPDGGSPRRDRLRRMEHLVSPPRRPRPRCKNKLEEPYNLRDALWTASMIHLFQRWGDKVTMANLAQMVNVIAPIITERERTLPAADVLPAGTVQAGKRRSRRAHLERGSVVHVSPIRQRAVSGCLRHQRRSRPPEHRGGQSRQGPVSTRRSLSWRRSHRDRGGKVFTIDGPSTDAMNSFEKPDVVAVSTREHQGFGARFSFEFPAHSVTLLQMAR